MKHVVLVIGPVGSGRSAYIDEHYKGYKKVDLKAFQYPFTSNEEAFDLCIKEFENVLKSNELVVVEHTLPKIRHRAAYVKKVKEYPNSRVDLVVMMPQVDNKGSLLNWDFVDRVNNYNIIFEPPALSDGFQEIIAVANH